MKVYGPYIRAQDGRKFVVIDGEEGYPKRQTKMYAKYLLEKKLGRKLYAYEDADHINNNCLDDSIDNLQVLPHIDNVNKSHIKGVLIHGTLNGYTHYGCRCRECSNKQRDYEKQYKENAKLAKA